MLSLAKVRIHGMQDDNWVIKDKINQYRGLIKLYERDRKIHEGDLAKQKRRYSRDIRQLRKDISTKRQELGVAVYGDKQFLRNAFQEHRRLQLTYMNSQADRVLESIHQENFNKRKQLDRIRFTKKKKMENFRLTQLVSAELRDRLLYEVGGKLPAEKKEQAVANYVQSANIKKNAALAIKVMYKKILDILKKDSSYFTVVLDALKLDCRAQGKCLMGATEMGQLAMEYLDDRKFEFNQLEKEIKTNMKERERTLKLVRREVAYLIDSFPNLIRKEEATNLDDLYEEEDNVSLHSVHWELEEVMGICKRLQIGTLVSSFDKILLRLKEQRYQSERLMTQLTQNSMKRDALIEDRKHAILMLDSLKNVGQEQTAQYILEKNKLKASLEAERREEQNLTEALDEKGKLIIEMKTSLQQINQLLSSVGAANIQRAPRTAPTAIQYALDELIQPVPEVEPDFDKLIYNARQKLNTLIQAISKMDVTSEVRANANLFYHNILARSMRDSYKEEAVAEGGLIEFEIEDPNVPSHAIIKLRSKQLVEAQVSEFDVPDQPTKK
ncbi:outer dynein arm-docking complex subunit 3 [Battus philenor]|uniref:outer dynein arm-docking complex subunit 3 n=1 Tax=Battus philenor TaxID=42288 RepID=UPI0035D0ECD7